MQAVLNKLADVGGTFWMPPSASTVAPEIDRLYYWIYGICVFFFFLVTGLLVLFAWKYRHRPGYTPGEAPKHNTALELTWTFIPTVIVVVIFYYGFIDFMHLAVPPSNSYEIIVTARMWSYTFRYPNQHVDNVLHVPVNVPVEIILNSDDVIHGFYIPVFRVKKDDVPGRYNKIWFEATQISPPEGFDIFCTQFCGQGHSTMRSKVHVDTQDDFNNWLNKASHFVGTPPEVGKHLWETRGCNQCHTIDGSAGKAPTWKDVFLSTVAFKDGTSQVADEDYLHGVIMNPNSKPIPGFDAIMPPTAGLVNEEDVRSIIAFIKTLSKNYHPVPMKSGQTRPSNGASGEQLNPTTNPANMK
jgi:cytochrome c oxidase subunit 2